MADSTNAPSILDSVWYALQQLPALVGQMDPEISVVKALQPTVNAIVKVQNFGRPDAPAADIDFGALIGEIPGVISTLINNWSSISPPLKQMLAVIVENLPTVMSQLPSLFTELALRQAQEPDGIAKIDIVAILPKLMENLPTLLNYFNDIMPNILGNLAESIDQISRTPIGGLVGYVEPEQPVYDNLSLNGGSGADKLTGGGGNDTLNGGAGADSMTGGGGNDLYYVDSSSDKVIESSGGGKDTVISSLSAYTLGSNVENLTLDSGAVKGVGNELDNTLTGNALANRLEGGKGNDTLIGGAGADTMIGGDGNDTYYVDSASDVVTESAQNAIAKFFGLKDNTGIDNVFSSINYTLGANVENLKLVGTALNGTGNGLNNILIGNELNNTLTGGGGNDTMDGGIGADTMNGGTGNDIYFVDDSADLIVDAGGSDSVVTSVEDYVLGSGLENLHLNGWTTYGTGNAVSNVVQGNFGDNVLYGLAGNDTLYGAAGYDRLEGGDGNDALYGATGDDTLVGGIGNDLLDGGVGADTYIWGRGQGQDTVWDGDAISGFDLNYDGVIDANDIPRDVVQLDGSVNSDQLWFTRSGDDLKVSVIGTTDTLTVKQWYKGQNSDAYHIEQFQAADGKVLASADVDKLVNAMASFAPVAAGQTTLPQPYHDALAGVLAASWKTV